MKILTKEDLFKRTKNSLGVEETDAPDYYNNCPWTTRDCLDCGEYLGKY